MRRITRRISRWLRPARMDAEIDAEMNDHLSREIEDHLSRGLSREEATRLARRDFGGVERFKDESRDVLGLRFLDDLGRDVGYALRLLRRSPGFTVAVVLTFALGIGCTAAIFALVNGILLRPLPYAHPRELVALWESNASRAVDHNVVSVSLFERWRDETRSFSAIAAMVPAPLTIQGDPAERITAAQVSASYFKLLGVRPALGRDFTNADESSEAPVAILSDAFWRTHFGGNPSVIGRPVVMDRVPYTIIGVMPRDFEAPRFGWMTEDPLWIPFTPTAGNRGWGRFLHVIARLRPGVTVAQARSELVALSKRRAAESQANREWSATAVSLDEQITGDVRRPMMTLFAAVTLLLLIAVANVANLVATFTRRRGPELAVRRALGATRWRLQRQQLALSISLGMGATLIAIMVAFAATRGLVALMPNGVPRLDGARVDRIVVAFILSAACVTTAIVAWLVASGAVPQFTSASLETTRATRRLSGSRLVASEIAIGLVLSVLAALMVRSFVNLASVDLGFQPGQVVTARITLPANRYSTNAQQRQFFEALRARVAALPGVQMASIATTAPLNCCPPSTTVQDAIRVDDSRAPAPTTDVRFVDDAYFATIRIPLVRGREFAANEGTEGEPRAVISRALARSLWGEDANPVGRRVALYLFGTTVAEVVGVVGDTRYRDVRTPPRPAIYLSVNRFPSNERDLIVRGSGNDEALISSLRSVLTSLDKSVPLYRAASLDHAVQQTFASERVLTALLGGFAALALLLAAVGVHGVLSADVTRRRKEIGIRVALGADPVAVYGLVLRRVTAPTVGGLAIGLVAALLLARMLSALVFGVTTSDPLSIGAVIVTLLVVALVATWLPAFRATRISPVEAIKTD